MKELLKYLKAYKKESILGPLFKLLEASFELLVPIVMAKIIDVGIANRDMGYIGRMCGFMVLLGVIGLLCSVTAQYYAAKASVGMGTGLRHDLFSHIQNLSYTEIDTIGTSTLMTRMTSDINQVQSGVNMALRLFLRSPFIVFGAMVMAFTINRNAALIFAGVIPLLSIVVFGIMLVSIPLYKKVQKKLDAVLGKTKENLEGVRVIRAFNREEEEKRAFGQVSGELVDVQVFVGKISALMNPLTYILINGAIIVLLWAGGKEVDHGIITQGEVVALVNYMSQILVELVKLANLIITFTKAMACANRVNDVLREKPSISKTQMGSSPAFREEGGAEKVQTGGAAPHVQFCNVTFAYKNTKEPSLENIDFTAERGQTIGIIGGTGSGKTTLINLIPRFYDVTRGSIRIDGRDVRDYPPEILRKKIGIVPQRAVLFKGTLRDNLRWGKADASEEQMEEALKTAETKEFVEKKEAGLDMEIAQSGGNLSGGQKQRLTIARALIRKPDILILDDSASALDFATDARLRRAIREMEGERTVFLVSQRAATIRYADQIIVLEDGKMAGIGTHEELLKSCQTYEEIYYSQTGKEAVQ